MMDLIYENLWAWLAQVLVLLAVGAILPVVFRILEPRLHLLYGHLVLCAALTLPLLQPWEARVITFPVGGETPLGTDSTATGLLAAAPGGGPGWDLIVLWTLALGISLRLLWLGLGLFRLGRYRASAHDIRTLTPPLRRAASLTGAKARFALSREVSGPVTFGLRRPVVLLPESFAGMDSETQLAVACHELLHVRRRDWLQTLVEELYRTLFWFHPGVWSLSRGMRLAREECVDREVIRLTGRREGYIRTLMQSARVCRAPHPSLASSLGGRRTLAHRLRSLLREVPMSRRRAVLSYAAMAAIAFATAWAALGLFPMTGQAELRIASTLTPPPPQDDDAADGAVEILVPDPRIREGERQSVVVELTYNSDNDIIDTRVLRGPEDFRETALRVAIAQNRRFETRLARLQIVVTFIATTPVDPESPRQRDTNRRSTLEGAIRVGGRVMEARRLYFVRPDYPELARRARVEGAVVFNTVIKPDGDVYSLEVVSGHELLRQAANDAVSLWRYEPYLLDGNPVPVATTVVVNFTLD